MRHQTILEHRINAVLSQWNPLEVPEFIAEAEYKSYVKPITNIGKNADGLEAFLKNLLSTTFGLGFDEDNLEHKKDVDSVVIKLMRAFDVPENR